jgi:hypothetical protein
VPAENDPELPEAILRLCSHAKRHHYVPKFLLRHFSVVPGEQTPQIWRLDRETGRSDCLSVENCAVVHNYNRLSGDLRLPSNSFEAFLSYIEEKAAPVVKKLVAGQQIDKDERRDIATFIFTQHRRTPRGRAWGRFMQEQAVTQLIVKRLHDRDAVRDVLRSRRTEEPTGGEVDEAEAMVRKLKEGTLKIRASQDREVLGQLFGMEEVVPIIYRMCWTVLRAPADSAFILSDDPAVLHDPACEADSPVGWGSSAKVQMTLPLDPSTALLLDYGPVCSQFEKVVDRAAVEEVNLRTYAGAFQAIFGASPTVVQAIDAVAKRSRDRVNRLVPVSPQMIVTERVEGDTGPHRVNVLRPSQVVSVSRPRRRSRKLTSRT